MLEYLDVSPSAGSCPHPSASEDPGRQCDALMPPVPDFLPLTWEIWNVGGQQLQDMGKEPAEESYISLHLSLFFSFK